MKHASREVKKVLSLEFSKEAWVENISLGVICIIKKTFKVMRINRDEEVGKRMREEIKTSPE